MPVSYPTTDDPYPELMPGLEYGMQTWTIETTAGAVEAERGHGGYWNYKGTTDAIVAANVAEPWQLPGHPKCKCKRRFSRRDFMRFGKRVNLSAERDREGLVRVWVFLTKDQLALDEALKEQVKQLGWLPVSADHFRQMIKPGIAPIYDRATLAATSGGYRLPRAAVDAFFDSIDEAISELLDTRLIFDSSARQHEINSIRQKTAVADADFQTFLTTTSAAVVMDDAGADA